MPAFFDLLKEEENAAAWIALGHFIFVYIHPFFHGNGRTWRLAAAGRPWTVSTLDHRDAYMAALEAASVARNIVPLTELIEQITGEP